MISKELLSEVLKFENISNIGLNGCNEIVFRDSTYQDCKPRIIVNVHKLVHKNLKEWAKINNYYAVIDWSASAEQIFKQADELRNEIN